MVHTELQFESETALTGVSVEVRLSQLNLMIVLSDLKLPKMLVGVVGVGGGVAIRHWRSLVLTLGRSKATMLCSISGGTCAETVEEE